MTSLYSYYLESHLHLYMHQILFNTPPHFTPILEPRDEFKLILTCEISHSNEPLDITHNEHILKFLPRAPARVALTTMYLITRTWLKRIQCALRALSTTYRVAYRPVTGRLLRWWSLNDVDVVRIRRPHTMSATTLNYPPWSSP